MTKDIFDLMAAVVQIRNELHAAIYEHPDPDAAAALVAEDFGMVNTPSGSNASGPAGLHHWIRAEVAPHRPVDLEFRRISITGDRWRVAQEDIVGFTHDRELPWLLPGVAPTGRHAEILAISVVTVKRRKVISHRTLWDQSALLAQLEIDPTAVRLPHSARA